MATIWLPGNTCSHARRRAISDEKRTPFAALSEPFEPETVLKTWWEAIEISRHRLEGPGGGRIQPIWTHAPYLCHLAMAASRMTRSAHCRWRSTRLCDDRRQCDPQRRQTAIVDQIFAVERCNLFNSGLQGLSTSPPCVVTSGRAARASMPPLTRFLLISGSTVRALVRPPSNR